MKPVIGVLSGITLFTGVRSIEKESVNRAYLEAVYQNGGIPLVIPSILDNTVLEPLLKMCSGILFPGGLDVDPEFYGQEPDARLGEIDPLLDKVSFICAEYAFKKAMPVFGICRGMQLLNIAKGGTLYQDISLRDKTCILHNQRFARSSLAHSVEIKRDTHLFNVLGTEKARVNTMHHQSVDVLGAGLTATAYAPDGVMEAFENEDGSIIAVQWHPEELTKTAPVMNELFRHLIKRAADYIEM
jgi:Predicted glutamine amidotransferases